MSQQEEIPEKDLDQELRNLIPWAKSWRMLYTIVIGELVLLIVFFVWFSRAFL